jgi:small subunit ribosomal protein S3Ae
MAVGKNKKLMRGKKGGKKKVVDVMTKKEWYDIKAPSYFENRDVGKTLVTRSAGTKLAADGLRGRVFKVCLADLKKDESNHVNIKLKCEEVQGRDLLLNYHGMSLTTDKLRSLVKKWQTLIEAFVDAKTTDGYVLRLFCIGFTRKHKDSMRKTCYAQSAQCKQIRAKMVDTMSREASSASLKELVKKLNAESINADITKACESVYPLHDVYIRKVKVLKKPKFDIGKLLELHGETAVSKDGATVGRTETFVEPKALESV